MRHVARNARALERARPQPSRVARASRARAHELTPASPQKRSRARGSFPASSGSEPDELVHPDRLAGFPASDALTPMRSRVILTRSSRGARINRSKYSDLAEVCRPGHCEPHARGRRGGREPQPRSIVACRRRSVRCVTRTLATVVPCSLPSCAFAISVGGTRRQNDLCTERRALHAMQARVSGGARRAHDARVNSTRAVRAA